MIELKEWLLTREERVIFLVCHWGIIRSLTGRQFKNCEIGAFGMDQLLSDEQIMQVEV